MQGTQRIGNVTAGMMLIGAAVLDLVQFLLTLTVFLEPFSFLFTFLGTVSFGLWFMLLGVRYIGKDGGKKLLIAGGTTIAELIPFINALPVTTAGVLGIIAQTRIEDAQANMVEKASPRATMVAARQQKIQAARTARADAAREDREDTQTVRHANDNEPLEAREAA